jgi:DNA-binding transcriptional LysR family regulator
MELRHLRYFVAVAQEQSFSRAARRLNIAQPPLSMQIRDLESELGARLFNRTTRSVELTPIGAVLLPEAIRILDQTRISFERVQSLVTGLRNRVRLGILPTVAIEPFAGGLRSFRGVYPNVELQLEQGSVESLLEMVDEGRLDAAIVRPPLSPRRYEFRTLHRETLALLLPDVHPLGRYKRIPWRCMQGERVLLIEGNSRLGSTFVANCEKRKIRPKIDYCAQGLQSLYWMVSAGFGVCPFWTSEFKPPAASCLIRPFERPDPTLEIVLVWQKGNSNPWCERLSEALTVKPQRCRRTQSPPSSGASVPSN